MIPFVVPRKTTKQNPRNPKPKHKREYNVQFMSVNVVSTLLKRLKPITSIITVQVHHLNQNYHSLRFNNLLNSCSTLSHLKRIHALIVTTGSHQNLSLSTKLVALASIFSPTVGYARKLFDRTPHRDVFLWNTLIRAYADLGPCQEAIILYKGMRCSGFSPDNYTFPYVVRSCSVISALREGKQVHCNVVKFGFDLDVFVQSSLVSMYAQVGEISCMETVFGEMLVKSTVSWTAIISGYVQNGLFRKGLGLFIEMVSSGTMPNAVTLASVLPACAGLECLSLGKSVHGYGIKVGVDTDISLSNALISLYGKCESVVVARSLFDGMVVKSLVSWNVMIAAYEQNNSGRCAIKLFRRMLCEKVEYDYITMVSVISACANLGALGTGKWLHELVKKKGFEMNMPISNALIDMYAKCGDIDLAKEVFRKLPNRTVVSWTSIIGACASHGHAGDALKCFSEMIEEGIRPNSLTFTAVLNACRHSGLVEEGRKHFERMTKEYSIVPGLEQCACMVDLLGRAGCLSEAYEFIKRMPVEPDAGVWGALLGACRTHGNVELAELVAEQLFKLDTETVTFYILMSHVYAEAGRWEDVTRLRNLMIERDMKKLPGHSFVEANKRFHAFLAGSKSQPSWATQ